MGMKGISCSKCGRKSWKRLLDFDMAIYICKKCEKPQVHVSVSGASIMDILYDKNGYRKKPRTENEALFIAAVEQLQTQMENLIVRELMAEKNGKIRPISQDGTY